MDLVQLSGIDINGLLTPFVESLSNIFDSQLLHHPLVSESVPQGPLQFSSSGGYQDDKSKDIRKTQNTLWGVLWMTGIVMCAIVLFTAVIIDLSFVGIISYVFVDFFICSVWTDTRNPYR